jgi:hypothetical protein
VNVDDAASPRAAWHRAFVGRFAKALVAPASRRETLLWGLLLLTLALSAMHWNRRTVIVVPVSENPRNVIT